MISKSTFEENLVKLCDKSAVGLLVHRMKFAPGDQREVGLGQAFFREYGHLLDVLILWCLTLLK